MMKKADDDKQTSGFYIQEGVQREPDRDGRGRQPSSPQRAAAGRGGQGKRPSFL